MTDAEIIAWNVEQSMRQCLRSRYEALAEAKEHRANGHMKRHRRARKYAHNCLLLARRWLNHGAMPYWKPTDPRAINERERTEEIWILTERFMEKFRERS